MAERHDLGVAAEALPPVAAVFAGGPLGFLAFMVAAGAACLAGMAFVEPGKALACACVAVLPFAALVVGLRRGGMGTAARLATAAVLLGGAALAYQVQWGAVGAAMDAGKAGRCAFRNLEPLLTTDRAANWYWDCRSLLTRDEAAKACSWLKSNPAATSYRLRLSCD